MMGSDDWRWIGKAVPFSEPANFLTNQSISSLQLYVALWKKPQLAKGDNLYELLLC
uniref:Uncharacterized protein n=1 Tax=Arundo donax TaxID=35708 RepID=A0A0A9ERH4_ARUDO